MYYFIHSDRKPTKSNRIELCQNSQLTVFEKDRMWVLLLYWTNDFNAYSFTIVKNEQGLYSFTMSSALLYLWRITRSSVLLENKLCDFVGIVFKKCNLCFKRFYKKRILTFSKNIKSRLSGCLYF